MDFVGVWVREPVVEAEPDFEAVEELLLERDCEAEAEVEREILALPLAVCVTVGLTEMVFEVEIEAVIVTLADSL